MLACALKFALSKHFLSLGALDIFYGLVTLCLNLGIIAFSNGAGAKMISPSCYKMFANLSIFGVGTTFRELMVR